jgi:hypothetical protein
MSGQDWDGPNECLGYRDCVTVGRRRRDALLANAIGEAESRPRKRGRPTLPSPEPHERLSRVG